MNDEELGAAWALLDPTDSRRRRIDRRVQGWLEARDTPLVSEWIDLFRVAPVTSLTLAAAGAAAILATSPVLWLARVLW